MKNKWLSIVVVPVVLTGCHVNSGGQTYKNNQLHFSIQLPAIVHQVDPKTLTIQQPPKPDDTEFMLLTARQGDEPYGMVMFAEKLNVGKNQLVDGADFIRRVEHTWGAAESLGESHFTNDQSIVFDEVEYKVGAEYDAAVVARIGDYLVVTRCNAKNMDDLHAMTASLKAMKKTA